MTQWGELGGTYGEFFASIANTLCDELKGTEYKFAPEVEDLPIAAIQNIYWREILMRAHWAAATTMLKNRNWLNACVSMMREPNHLGFAACARGFIEAGCDAVHGLKVIPYAIAQNVRVIEVALSGEAEKFVISSELEERLIHFLYARRLGKGETAPSGHKNEEMKTYIQAVEGPIAGHVTECYSDLCQIAHPAAQSNLWLSSHLGEAGEIVRLTGGDDRTQIERLRKQHGRALEDVLEQSTNSALLTLWVINRLPIALIVPSIESLPFDTLPHWSEIRRLLGDAV